MTEKTIAWLRTKIAEASPPSELESGEIGVNVAALAQAVGTLRAGGSMLFGLDVASDVIAQAGPELLAQGESALADWKRRLESEFGEEGREAFASIALRHGIMLEPAASLRRDPDVSRALTHLFAALDDVDRATRNARAANKWVYEDSDRLAYFVDRTPDPVGFAQLAAEIEVPAQLEGLYAELDELVIGSNAHGGKCDSRVDDYSVIAPVAAAEVVDIEDDSHVLLHQQDMGRMLMVRLRDGAVLLWISKFEEHPTVVAPSIAAYFEQLAAQLSA